MITNYEEAIMFIHSKKDAGIAYSLDRMTLLMKHLGHPERKIKAVHVAGTNGKGSVCAFLGSILKEAGYDTGSFNTPAFGEERNQLSVNSLPLSEEAFTKGCQAVYTAVKAAEDEKGEKISEFECLTAIAINYFAYVRPVDFVLVEAGMGGRLDATNIINSPLAAIITNVGMDHQKYLGSQLTDIAREKAGIIKTGAPVFTASRGEALQVIKQAAEEKGSSLFSLSEEVELLLDERSDKEQSFTYKPQYGNADTYSIQLKGRHQMENSGLAVAAVRYFMDKNIADITPAHLRKGLIKTFIPGRWEAFLSSPSVFLDTAHNLEAIATVRNNIRTVEGNRDITILFAAMKDKPAADMMNMLSTVKGSLNVTEFSSERSLSGADYRKIINSREKFQEVNDVGNWAEWLDQWLNLSDERDVLVITGSHQFVGECRQFLKKRLG
ncbi:bifunctional folylpolyglutamate synthase/dihydrofolate synthase [Salipaludibacillus sp. CUR1]|uniref:bifunctional folylpolyglutamate synthase/dihydrofolate synthase n=1 Tax=Salipaludibacillus sp. CUR1 TaxID=2820003 RepID=UPI001E61BBD8|nr:folylpolyglutamate synthase/dihydrofolate synthase family protein [Salipaludibacillus sp. CUR1]MCE7793492.1 bifunctional folylpolyglutamate synthase/dihydrofolate synthase [Salipaludibacillus sp. CUR1]